MKDIQAFPCDGVTTFKGMTLRDYFAAKALSGITSDYKAMSKFANVFKHNPLETLAEHCYEIADAMIKERKKGDQNGK